MMKEKTTFNHKLLTLVFPIAFQQFMLALVSASDTFMLGMLSQDSLSAVSLASQITFVENLFLMAMTIGLSMFAAQYWGKGADEDVERFLGYVMKVTAAVSFLFFLAGIFLPEALMRIFTGEKALIEGGVVYLRTVALSFLLTGISQVYLCVLKNTGRAAKSSLISSASVVVNIVLNAIFIFGWHSIPEMGIAGAAMATVMARMMEVIWCIGETRRGGSIRLRTHYFLYSDKPLRKAFWKYTAPVLGNEIVWGVGYTMYSVIMGHLGSDAVAANSVANIVKNLVACFCLGLGSGGGILVGNELGADRLDEAKRAGDRLCRLSVVCGIISGGILWMVSPLILAGTNLSATAQGYLKWMLAMCAVYMVGKSVNGTTIGGIFCAGGDSRFGFLCDAVTMWCITVPLGLLTAFVFRAPVLVVYGIVNLDEMVKLPAVYLHYKKYRWVHDLTAEQESLF